MANGSETTFTTGNGGPMGILSAIAKKDGVLGLFLVALCVFIWLDKKSDREDRESDRRFQQQMWDSLAASHHRESHITIKAIEAEDRGTKAIQDNTRVLRRVDRRFPPLHRDDG